MRGEFGEIAIATLLHELDKSKAEIEVKDMVIANLENQLSGTVRELKGQEIALESLENQLSGTIAEIKERDMALTNLNSEIEGLRGEIDGRDMALESLKSESRGGGDKPLSLFPTESTPIPEIIPELIPIPSTGTIGRNDLFKYILEKFPDSEMNPQKITDAVRDRDKGNGFSRLSFYERDYGFKFVGKIKGENRFQIV
ncbi:MAG: hypothetical protein ACOVOV_10135 [Dolichospermum sp.]